MERTTQMNGAEDQVPRQLEPFEELEESPDSGADEELPEELDDAPEDVSARPGGLLGALEAVLMVTDEPISAEELAQLVQRPVGVIEESLLHLQADYDAASPVPASPHEAGAPASGAGYNGKGEFRRPRGFQLRKVAGGWRFYSRAEFADVVARYMRDGRSSRLTQAALETLAVIAYRQPVSRSKISAIRGVNVDGVVRTLVQRGLAEEVGTEESTGATLYRTTKLFLEKVGIESVEELPILSPLLPGLDEISQFDHG